MSKLPFKIRYEGYIFSQGKQLFLDDDGNLVDKDLTQAEIADMMRLFHREEEYDDDLSD